MHHRGKTALVAGALVVLGGCTDRGTSPGEPEPSTVDGIDVDGKPTVEIGEGSTPPDELTVEDLEEGDGEEVTDGTMVTMHYVGVAWSSSSEFASSWDRGQPMTYEHGQGRWVEGWERGLEGMRVGGQRRIVVPPELGYGDRGAPGVAGGETLVFVIDLLDVG